jgi:hypothetical protein
MGLVSMQRTVRLTVSICLNLQRETNTSDASSFKYWQDGAPSNVSSIISRLVNPAYWERQCPLYFPPENGYTYGIANGKTVDDVNAYTGGWNYVNTTRLIWINGQYDPWKDATVSSDYRPNGPLVSTSQAPVSVIPGGIHCSDLIYSSGTSTTAAKTIVSNEIATIKGWVQDFYNQKGLKMPNME